MSHTYKSTHPPLTDSIADLREYLSREFLSVEESMTGLDPRTSALWRRLPGVVNTRLDEGATATAAVVLHVLPTDLKKNRPLVIEAMFHNDWTASSTVSGQINLRAKVERFIESAAAQTYNMSMTASGRAAMILGRVKATLSATGVSHSEMLRIQVERLPDSYAGPINIDMANVLYEAGQGGEAKTP